MVDSYPNISMDCWVFRPAISGSIGIGSLQGLWSTFSTSCRGWLHDECRSVEWLLLSLMIVITLSINSSLLPLNDHRIDLCSSSSSSLHRGSCYFAFQFTRYNLACRDLPFCFTNRSFSSSRPTHSYWSFAVENTPRGLWNDDGQWRWIRSRNSLFVFWWKSNFVDHSIE